MQQRAAGIGLMGRAAGIPPRRPMRTDYDRPHMRLNQLAGYLASMMLAAVSTLVLVSSVTIPGFNPIRFGVAVAVLLVLHALQYPRLFFCREFLLYAILAAYMFLSLLWAPDVELGFNTLLPAVDFLLILMLFGSVARYHEPRAVVVGVFFGFLTGAARYSYVTGFPFTYPEDFSYNSIAGMYLFGLLATLIVGWRLRARILPSVIGVILLFNIAATTSIKTNLGIALGAAISSLIYFRQSLRALRRGVLFLVVLFGAFGYMIVSSEALVERLDTGFDRVNRGFEVLMARDNGAGLSVQSREVWKDAGIRGWLLSPVLGNGVEGFRSDNDITSHSTPIDLLYNFGVIGCSLFYMLLASVAWRVWRLRSAGADGLCALMLGAVVCYAFMSLSGIIYYDAFLAAFLGMGIALLQRGTLDASLDEKVRAHKTESAVPDSGQYSPQ